MREFLSEIPSDMEWQKDMKFLYHFEAARLLLMRRALIDAGINADTPVQFLDFGYLHGLVPEFLHRFFPKSFFTICDRPASSIFRDKDYQKAIASRPYLRLLPCDLADADKLDGQFDVIVLGEIVEHLDPTFAAKVFKSLRERIKPKGVILITTQNAASFYACVKLLTGVSPNVPPVPDAQMGYGHIYVWTPQVLSMTLESFGWKPRTTYFYHGREAEMFSRSWHTWGSFRHQCFAKTAQLVAGAVPRFRGFFVTTAIANDRKN